jgi:surfactin synthase thioesterase subunit
MSELTTKDRSPAGGRRHAWIRCPHPRPEARLRLFCLPHAGGGASAYRNWGPRLPAWIEACPVQLPGREDRLAEPAHDRVESLLAELAPAMAGHLDKPFALFGHSMGASIAHGLALELQRALGATARHVFVSARSAPHVPPAEPPIHGLPDGEFLAAMQRRYSGMPAGELLQNQKLLEIFLPLLCADLALSERYVHAQARPLPCPLTAFGGLSDPWVGADGLAEWAAQAGSGFDLECFEGGHFYLAEAPQPVLAAIARRLQVYARW